MCFLCPGDDKCRAPGGSVGQVGKELGPGAGGAEVTPEGHVAHSWRAWGLGSLPQLLGRYLRAGESHGAGGHNVQGAFGSCHTGASGIAEAQAGAEGASWAGLTAPLGDATWRGRQKDMGSASPHRTVSPEDGDLCTFWLTAILCARMEPGHWPGPPSGLCASGGQQHGRYFWAEPHIGQPAARLCPPQWDP